MTDVNRRSNFESVQNGEEDRASTSVATTTESSATTEAKKEPGVAVGAACAEPGFGECPPELTTERWTSTQRALALTRDAPPPEDLLLEAQLATSARVEAFGIEGVEGRLMDDAIDLYRRLEPQNPIESLLARLMVGVTNASMDCLGRAVRCNDSSPARDLNLRYGMKGGADVANLVKVWDSRRGQSRQNVTVGTVSVEAGGRAVVGNVEIGEQRKQTTSPIPRASITETDDY